MSFHKNYRQRFAFAQARGVGAVGFALCGNAEKKENY